MKVDIWTIGPCSQDTDCTGCWLWLIEIRLVSNFGLLLRGKIYHLETPILWINIQSKVNCGENNIIREYEWNPPKGKIPAQEVSEKHLLTSTVYLGFAKKSKLSQIKSVLESCSLIQQTTLFPNLMAGQLDETQLNCIFAKTSCDAHHISNTCGG